MFQLILIVLPCNVPASFLPRLYVDIFANFTANWKAAFDADSGAPCPEV
jgi:hypothetical protein